jgi:hypothetical protein
MKVDNRFDDLKCALAGWYSWKKHLALGLQSIGTDSIVTENVFLSALNKMTCCIDGKLYTFIFSDKVQRNKVKGTSSPCSGYNRTIRNPVRGINHWCDGLLMCQLGTSQTLIQVQL